MPDKSLSKQRPVREVVEERLQTFKGGPLEFTGEGNMVGAVGYFGTKAANNALLVGSLGTIGGVDVGFRVISHGVETQGSKERHTVRVHAFSQDVARYAAKYMSAPSNIDYAARRADVIEETMLEERSTASTWEIVVEIEQRFVGSE